MAETGINHQLGQFEQPHFSRDVHLHTGLRDPHTIQSGHTHFVQKINPSQSSMHGVGESVVGMPNSHQNKNESAMGTKGRGKADKQPSLTPNAAFNGNHGMIAMVGIAAFILYKIFAK